MPLSSTWGTLLSKGNDEVTVVRRSSFLVQRWGKVPWMIPAALFASAFFLCGERIRFDGNLAPQFTATQVQESSAATRDGLLRYAATPHGRALIQHFDDSAYEVRVFEDPSEDGAGRAPEPGLATLISTRFKSFVLILNPNFVIPKGMVVLPNQPATPADIMAAAWAGEML